MKFLIAFLWATLLVTGCQTTTERFNGGNEPTESQGQNDLVVSDLTTEREPHLDITNIVGIVTNTGKNEYAFVDISFNIYDADGNQVDTAMDSIQNLEPGGRWKFKAMIPRQSHGTYKLKEVSGMVKQSLN